VRPEWFRLGQDNSVSIRLDQVSTVY